MALLLGATLFVVAIPLSLFLVSPLVDAFLSLPRFVHGFWSPVLASLLVASGGFMALWSVVVQLKFGKGTPVPMVPTQKLVVRGPYAYCRNPMAMGALLLYIGIGIWMGSLSAIGLTALIGISIVGYIKGVEEKELEARFGTAYLDYKRNTPFMIPRRPKRGAGGGA